MRICDAAQIGFVVLFARFHCHIETVEGTFTDLGLHNFPVPATCVGLLVTADLASLPDGTLVL